MSIEEFIKNLTKEDLQRINEEFQKKENSKPSYKYSQITIMELENLVEIKENFNKEIFTDWFNNEVNLSKDIEFFLKELITDNEALIKSYREEDLKVNFIIPLLNKVKFKSYENEFREFYELPLKYDTESFNFNGVTDFVVSKGLKYAKKPYFFIQEFKKSKSNSDPEPQLLAELISAVELNNWKTIKGAYLIGAHWNFIILNRFEKHKYEYFVSRSFDSMRLDDLKSIYKNLLFVKNEIIEMVKRGE